MKIRLSGRHDATIACVFVDMHSSDPTLLGHRYCHNNNNFYIALQDAWNKILSGCDDASVGAMLTLLRAKGTHLEEMNEHHIQTFYINDKK